MSARITNLSFNQRSFPFSPLASSCYVSYENLLNGGDALVLYVGSPKGEKLGFSTRLSSPAEFTPTENISKRLPDLDGEFVLASQLIGHETSCRLQLNVIPKGGHTLASSTTINMNEFMVVLDLQTRRWVEIANDDCAEPITQEQEDAVRQDIGINMLKDILGDRIKGPRPFWNKLYQTLGMASNYPLIAKRCEDARLAASLDPETKPDLCAYARGLAIQYVLEN